MLKLVALTGFTLVSGIVLASSVTTKFHYGSMASGTNGVVMSAPSTNNTEGMRPNATTLVFSGSSVSIQPVDIGAPASGNLNAGSEFTTKAATDGNDEAASDTTGMPAPYTYSLSYTVVGMNTVRINLTQTGAPWYSNYFTASYGTDKIASGASCPTSCSSYTTANFGSNSNGTGLTYGGGGNFRLCVACGSWAGTPPGGTTTTLDAFASDTPYGISWEDCVDSGGMYTCTPGHT